MLEVSVQKLIKIADVKSLFFLGNFLLKDSLNVRKLCKYYLNHYCYFFNVTELPDKGVEQWGFHFNFVWNKCKVPLKLIMDHIWALTEEWRNSICFGQACLCNWGKLFASRSVPAVNCLCVSLGGFFSGSRDTIKEK